MLVVKAFALATPIAPPIISLRTLPVSITPPSPDAGVTPFKVKPPIYVPPIVPSYLIR